MTGTDLVMQLLECCEDDLRKDLTRTAGGSLAKKTEAQVLAAIKVLAVRQENVMVARVALNQMRQDHNEPVRTFAARVKGQADICNFQIKCSECDKNVSYTESAVKDVVIIGLADQDIQLEVFGHINQDMSLSEILQYVKSKESGKRSAMQINSFSDQQAAASTYRRQTSAKVKDINDQKDNETCTYCGKTGHGKNPKFYIRRKKCPAFGHVCGLCSKSNHFETACRSGSIENTSKSNVISDQDTVIRTQ